MVSKSKVCYSIPYIHSKRKVLHFNDSKLHKFLSFYNKIYRAKWRRANNATGTSNGHSNQHTINSNGGGGGVCDNESSESSDNEDLSQKPLQMYLHHQQYYKQMKELQKQQQQRKDTVSDNEDNV